MRVRVPTLLSSKKPRRLSISLIKIFFGICLHFLFYSFGFPFSFNSSSTFLSSSSISALPFLNSPVNLPNVLAKLDNFSPPKKKTAANIKIITISGGPNPNISFVYLAIALLDFIALVFPIKKVDYGYDYYNQCYFGYSYSEHVYIIILFLFANRPLV